MNTLTGLLSVDRSIAELFESLGASRIQIFRKLQVPSSLPFAVAELKLAATGALLGTIVAEFSSASQGLGVQMQRFAFRLDMESAIVTLITMSLTGLFLFVLMELIEWWLIYWHHEDRKLRVGERRKARWMKREA